MPMLGFQVPHGRVQLDTGSRVRCNMQYRVAPPQPHGLSISSFQVSKAPELRIYPSRTRLKATSTVHRYNHVQVRVRKFIRYQDNVYSPQPFVEEHDHLSRFFSINTTLYCRDSYWDFPFRSTKHHLQGWKGRTERTVCYSELEEFWQGHDYICGTSSATDHSRYST